MMIFFGPLGGGGGGTAPPDRQLGPELGGIFKAFNKQEYPALQKFFQNEPLLSNARDFALSSSGDLQSLFGNLPPSTELTGPLSNQLGRLYGPGGLEGRMRGLENYQLPNTNLLTGPLMRELNPLRQAYQRQLAPVLTSGGALTQEQKLEADRESLAQSALAGNVHGNQGLASQFLNRDVNRRAREAEAYQMAQSNLGLQLGLSQGTSGLQTEGLNRRLALEQGIQGLGSADLTQKLGLATGIQGLQGQDIQNRLGLSKGILGNLTGTEQAGVGSFATLMNPLLSYGSDLYNTNYNAQAASNIGAANNKGATTGAGIGAIGAIGGGIAIAV